ncbi:MAG: ATP-dependent Clp protease ATP-binding subunit, partial [Candidatus Veblenbacteria bacterium]|nr:ATP-dependent Clp protease ATP-binding subunit [Candidatus Veblenbacteria bacterium]
MPQFAWQTHYTLLELVFRRLRLTVYRAVAFAAIVLALASLSVFVLVTAPLMFQYGQWNIFLPPTPGAKLLWFAILLAVYAWYRLEREHAWYPPLPVAEADTVVVERHLSEETWRVLELAYRYAYRLKQAVDPLHLLAASLSSLTGRRVFSRLGVDTTKLASTLRNALARLPLGKSSELSATSSTALLAAAELALKRKGRHVAMSEVLVALGKSDSLVRDVLEELSVKPEALENVTAWYSLRRKLVEMRTRQSRRSAFRPRHALDRTYSAVATPFLNRVSRDLTAEAARGYLMPCVGRDREIAEAFRLVEGGQGSVVFVGEPGMGRGLIIEGMAQVMAAEEVPRALQDKHLLLISVAQLLSGAAPSEAGERLLQVLNEAVRAGNIVLAIEDVHQIVGLDAGSGRQLSLGDVLANVVASYQLIVLATTTNKDWRDTLERSPLGHVLQRVEVAELDDNSSIQVLESRVGTIEHQHRMYFSYGALENTVTLARRFMPDRYLPEKAITLLEEVVVFARERVGGGGVVTAEHVAQVVASKVHVPVAQITAGESEKLLNLEQILHQRIIGQDEAVKLVSEALRRGRVDLRDQKRPVASFLFLGPTGVGKTELAKVVAQEYFGGEDKMVRLDMSEYQTAESLYRLVGAPGRAGEERGLLTEAVHRTPYTLVLLDELEKAHSDILNVFLQVLDDGRLTDAAGHTISFNNAIIIATSNAATSFIQEQLQQNVPLDYIRRGLLKGGLTQYFRPEFLNRFDAIVVFRPLEIAEVEQVAELMIKKLARELEAKGVHLRASPEAVRELAHKGFDPL